MRVVCQKLDSENQMREPETYWEKCKSSVVPGIALTNRCGVTSRLQKGYLFGFGQLIYLDTLSQPSVHQYTGKKC